MKKIKLIKYIFLLPCLPYYIILSMWVITSIFENNHNNVIGFFDLSVDNLNVSDKLNYNRTTSMIKPFEYGYAFVFWIYFLKYNFADLWNF